MNRRILKLGAAVGGVLVLALGGAAIARATGAFDDGESHTTGPQADRAKAAALELTGGGHANAVERGARSPRALTARRRGSRRARECGARWPGRRIPRRASS